MNKELSLSSKIENISLIENLVDEVSVELSLLADVYGNILIAVIEGVTNAILHGNQNDSSKKVHISLTTMGKDLIFRIQDEGEGFDYNNLPDPTKPDNLENPDGRGVFLMTHLADEVVFDKGGAVVILKFKVL